MSIADFEATLKGSLVADFAKVSAKNLYIDMGHWIRALTPEEKNWLIEITHGDEYSNFLLVYDFVEMEKFLQSCKLKTYIRCGNGWATLRIGQVDEH